MQMQQVWQRHAPRQMDVLVSDLMWWRGGFYWYRRETTEDPDSSVHVRAGVAECLSAFYWQGQNANIFLGDLPTPNGVDEFVDEL